MSYQAMSNQVFFSRKVAMSIFEAGIYFKNQVDKNEIYSYWIFVAFGKNI